MSEKRGHREPIAPLVQLLFRHESDIILSRVTLSVWALVYCIIALPSSVSRCLPPFRPPVCQQEVLTARNSLVVPSESEDSLDVNSQETRAGEVVPGAWAASEVSKGQRGRQYQRESKADSKERSDSRRRLPSCNGTTELHTLYSPISMAGVHHLQHHAAGDLGGPRFGTLERVALLDAAFCIGAGGW
jgi:hypothetical protein